MGRGVTGACLHNSTCFRLHLSPQMGDQTSGKSSLVEALGYGIRLPSKAGTCTKAPLELRLHPGSSADGCACRVSFRSAAPARRQEQQVCTLTAEECQRYLHAQTCP